MIRNMILILLSAIVALYGIDSLFTFGLLPFGFGLAVMISEIINMINMKNEKTNRTKHL